MADKKIKIEVDLDAEPSIAKLKQLKKALKEVTAGSDDWNLIKNSINDTEDALKSAGQGADNFAEIIGTLPGPLGELGNKLGSTVNTLKIFGGIKLDALKNSFTELGKDIVQAGSSILKITGIQKLYTITTIAMSKALKFVGIEATVASFGVKAFSAALVASGIGAIVVALGFLISAFMNTGEEADTTAGKVARLNAELSNTERVSKLRNAEEIARAKAKGATESQLFNIKQKQTQKELDDARNTYKIAEVQMTSAEVLRGKDSKGYIDAQKLKGEAAVKIEALKSQLLVDGYNEEDRLRKESISKIKPAKEDPIVKAKEEALKLIAKNEKEAALSLLDEREQEKRKVVNDYNDQIKLAAANGTDTLILEEAKLNALKILKDKFKKEDDNKKKEDDATAATQRKDQFELDKANLDLQRAQKLIDEDTYQIKLKELRVKYAEGEIDKINAQIDHLNYVNDEKDKGLEKDKERAKEQEEINKQVTQSWIDLGSNIANTFQQLAGLFEQGSDMAKTFGIISVLINAAAAIGKVNLDFAEAISSKKKAISIAADAVTTGTAMFPVNPIVGGALIGAGTAAGVKASAGLALLQANKFAQIATIGITSGAQIAAILSAKKGATASAGSSGGSGASGGASGGALPAYSGAAVGMAAPQIQTTNATNPSTQIAQTLGTAQAPIKAYIVSGEVSSQQALDRRTSRAATFA